MLVAAVLFWLSLLAIFYAYAGYPALMWLVSRSGRVGYNGRVVQEDASLPMVSLIISVYNEEKVIRSKLENALSLDYPAELLEIVIVSDGSTDRTCQIVEEYAQMGVVLRSYGGRRGKTACLNAAVPMAAGQIVVFSDANSVYTKGALRALSRPFDDPSVGFVTGWTKYGTTGESSSIDSVGIYTKIELITKEGESRLASCIGADGAIFAIRKELYKPLADYDINDFVIPLSINQQGYRGVLQRDAVCIESDAGDARGEYQRQVRITCRTIRAIVNYRRLLNPFTYGWLSFELVSHKICKFMVPLFMATLLLSNALLAALGGLYLAALFGQGVFYVVASMGLSIPKSRTLSRLPQAIRTFVVVNAAVAVGWVKFFQGETYTTWSPTKR